MNNELENLRRKVEELKGFKAKCCQLEEILKQKEELFFKIFHTSSSPMSITTLKESRFIDVNEAYVRLSGYKREELIGHAADELSLLTDPKQGESIFRKLRKEGNAPSFELDVLTKTGEPLTILFSADAITVNGQPCIFATAVDLTAQRKEADALKRSEEKYRSLVENSLQGLAIIQDDRFVFCNATYAEMTGFSVEEVLSLSLSELETKLNPDDRAFLKKRRQDRAAGKPVSPRFEFRGIKKDGTEIWMEAHSSLIEYNGKPAQQIAVIDITERKRAEALAMESRERLQLALEAAGMVTWDLNNLTGDVMEDGSWLQNLGYQLGEIEPNLQSLNTLMHPDDLPEMERAASDHLKGKTERYEVEYRIRNKSGSWIWVMDRGKLVSRDSSGKPLRTMGVHLNITEHKHAEEKLRSALDWQKTLFEGSRDAIMLSDSDSMIVDVNAAAVALTGYSKEELLRMRGSDLNRETDLPKFEAIRNRILAGEDLLGEAAIFAKDGRKLDVEFGHQRVIVGGKLYIHTIARDITARKQLEAQFLQAQKMEAIGVLAGGVAHDFNNMLNVINGYTEVMLEDLASDDPMRKDVEQVRDAGQRAATLTTQLLAFGRKQILQPKILNLNDVVTGMHTMLRRLIRENIDLSIIAQPDLGLISADPGQIQQILMNLSVNARDAMLEGGKLSIETANAYLDEEYVQDHPAIQAGPYIMLAISDNGIGMDETTKSHLFEPFFTTKGQGKGTGLGLSTVYGIVKQSNAFIWVYSEPGQGTTFKIYFPRIEGESPEKIEGSNSESGTQGIETVLITEDEFSVRALAARILRARGYAVLEASNGKEALRIAGEYAGEIQLVLTDVIMPGMSGKDLVSKLKATRPGIKAFYISGYTDNAIVHHGILDPGIAFLQKPFTAENLARKVREVLNS